MTAIVRVGLDESAPARAALAWGARFAADFGHTLVIEHVIVERTALESPGEYRERLDDAEQLVQDARGRIVGEVDSVRVEAHVLVGEIVSSLAAHCLEQNILVIGTHKTGFLRGRAYTARSLQLVGATRCPVAVIPADHRANRTGVVVAVTTSMPGVVAEWAAEIAAMRDQPLLLVAQSPPDPHAAAALLAEARASVARRAPHTPVRTLVTPDRHAAALLDATGSSQLLVLADNSRDGGPGPLTYDVLLNITGPVMILRSVDGTFAPGVAGPGASSVGS